MNNLLRRNQGIAQYMNGGYVPGYANGGIPGFDNIPNNLPADRRGIEEILADIISGKTTPTTPTYDVTDPNFKFEPDLSVDYGEYGEDYNFDRSAYQNYIEATRTAEDDARDDLAYGVDNAFKEEEEELTFLEKMGKMASLFDVEGDSKDGTPDKDQRIKSGFEGFRRVGASRVPQTRRYESGGIASMMPMYMDDGGYATGFGFGNFGTDFRNPFLDGFDLTDEELQDFIDKYGLDGSGVAQNAANTINREDSISRGYGSRQDDRIARGVGPSKLNYEDTPSNILPGADMRIYARDENPAAYKFYPSEVSKLYSQMKGVPFSPLVAPPREATFVDELGLYQKDDPKTPGDESVNLAPQRRIQSQLYAKNGTYVQGYADGTGSMGVEDYPERNELVTGPGGERGDEIPAMLSDGEFVTNAAAVRGMGIMAGANPQDEYEQRLLGARQMYDYQRQAEEMAKRYA